MAEITLGVPVYNGAPRIDEALACLARQTFKDLRIVIFDNASTDSTGEICRRYVQEDSRFEYVRQPQNAGAAQNFLDSLDAAKTEYFSWRAYDDYSDDNFFEVLHALLEADSRKILASSQIVALYPDRQAKTYKVLKPRGLTRLARVSFALNHSHPSWIYGLWRTRSLRQAFSYALKCYPALTGQDNFVTFQAIYADQFIGTNETKFYQGNRPLTPGRRRHGLTKSQRIELFRMMHRACRQWAEEHVPPRGPIDTLRREAVLLSYALRKNKGRMILFSRQHLPPSIQRLIGYRAD